MPRGDASRFAANERERKAALKGRKMPARLKPSDADVGREQAREVLAQPEYLDILKKKAREGILPPPVENALWDRAFGKTKEMIQLEPAPNVTIIHKLRGTD